MEPDGVNRLGVLCLVEVHSRLDGHKNERLRS